MLVAWEENCGTNDSSKGACYPHCQRVWQVHETQEKWVKCLSLPMVVPPSPEVGGAQVLGCPIPLTSEQCFFSFKWCVRV